ncbi:MAG: phosphoribosylaminoimidazole-succinocarboxamide synthase [Candidatus Synechococcus spongiarum 142]|uniref:Phosphoribosylaminoimidazole-succinocarboxamide synthase n=1 Tax=Candidatus Synechococcus spongiarum 142 TaxID=1608213 RepID=A0A6N3X2U8_9SYNE|nr:MAG: phosphoribosylaminoimidazole-succinocarboxamide synthase [Candidatus Synechococcus spongiarum 142]
MDTPAPALGPLLREGKAKRLYATADSRHCAVEFKDMATASNGRHQVQVPGKGKLNCQISAQLFTLLEQVGLPTHFQGLLADGWMLVRPLCMIPLEVVLRNRAAGSLLRQLPTVAGQQLEPPLLDLYFKDDALGDPFLSEARLATLNIVTPQQRIQLETMARQVNSALHQAFGKLDLDLVDIKLEFGWDTSGQLRLADELSPDNCRLWDQRQSPDSPGRSLDKDRFRQGLGGLVDAYKEVNQRIQSLGLKPQHDFSSRRL